MLLVLLFRTVMMAGGIPMTARSSRCSRVRVELQRAITLVPPRLLFACASSQRGQLSAEHCDKGKGATSTKRQVYNIHAVAAVATGLKLHQQARQNDINLQASAIGYAAALASHGAP